MERRDNGSAPVDVTFVVIGYNEGLSLRACLQSVHDAELPSEMTVEVIYVDGGSEDDSITIAEQSGVDRILGGEKRRKASENRNLGLHFACGRYVQFIDGDMVMAPDWPAAGIAFLESRPEAAVVCGDLREARTGVFSKAFEIDWAPAKETMFRAIRHCGGAALYRREPLDRLGGFPEDVEYGEEPYLCWRIRNELQLKIFHVNRPMVDHELGYRGFADYWRRNVRCGATYAEIATRCMRTGDRLWLKECVVNVMWAAIGTVVLVGLFLGPLWVKECLVLGTIAVVARKWAQMWLRGHAGLVAMAYALHTYFCKLPLALGEMRWLLRRIRRV